MRMIVRLIALIAVIAPLLGSLAAPAVAQEPSFPPPLTDRFTLPDEGRIISLSPDGSMIVAISGDGDALCTYAVPSGDEIACGDLEENKLRLLAESVVWSPDSSMVAFAENAFQLLIDGDIWLMDAASGEFSNLTDDGFEGRLPLSDDDQSENPVPIDIAPAWSPDGSRIAFSRTIYPVGDADVTSELWLVDPATGETEQVAVVDPGRPGAIYLSMAWSPDGGTVYAPVNDFHGDPSDDGIWAYNVETGDAEQLLGPDPAYDNDVPAILSLSPSGDLMTVYYPNYINAQTSASGGYALFSIEDGSATPIDPPADLIDDEAGYLTSPTIAPDGETLLYYLRRFEEPVGLVIARDLATGEEQPLFTLPEGESPFPISLGQPIGISQSGLAFIPTEHAAGYLAQLPDADLTISASTPAAQATPEPADTGLAEMTPFEPADAERLFTSSPDGTMVVGASDLGPSELCTYAVPGGEVVACADLDAFQIRMEITDISWSPDSRTVAFAERPFRDFVDGDIWIMDAATGELTNLTDDGYEGTVPFLEEIEFDGPIYLDVIPRWSPDGSTIAFSRSVVTGNDGPWPSELWTVDLATGETRRVARVADDEMGTLYFNLAWSPDAATIYASLFHRESDDPENGVWAFDVASGEGEHVVAGTNEHFLGFAPAVMAVSPRGDYLSLYYPQFIGQYQASEGGYALFDLERGEVIELEAPEELEAETPVLTMIPGFSPDGASVIYGVRRFEQPEGALALLDLASGETELLTLLPEETRPFPALQHEGIRIDENGIAFMLTSINTGLFIPVPQAGLDAPPIGTVPPVEPDATATDPDSETGASGIATVGEEETAIYAAPSFDAPVVLNLDPGQELEVIGDPVTNDEGDWLPVRDPETRTIGYIPQDDLST